MVILFTNIFDGSKGRSTESSAARISKLQRYLLLTAENHTHIFSSDEVSRIGDGKGRMYSWLLSQSYDNCGNAIEYSYKLEDSVGILAVPSGIVRR